MMTPNNALRTAGMRTIRQIAIAGGVHGNELIGIYLIKKFERYPELVQRSSVNTLTLLGNPQAFLYKRRYIDKDLNRCFLAEDLQDTTLTGYEDQRAKEIYHHLQKHETPIDLLIDLHSTTANMGLTLILNNDHPLMLQIAAYLSSLNPQVKVYSCAGSGREHDSIRSLYELSITIEVGAIPQGVLDADLFQQTETLIYQILDYLEQRNQNIKPLFQRSLTVYRFLTTVDYPRDSQGEIQAMVHPQRQGKDYEALNPGDPLFFTFDRQTIVYSGAMTVYPIFVNEAAYYEKGIAMSFTQKQSVTVSIADL